MSDYNRNDVLKILKHERSKESFYGNHMKAAFEMSIDAIEKLEKIEQIVEAYKTDNPKEPYYDTEVYMDSIEEVIEHE